MTRIPITLHVNGEDRAGEAEPRKLLSDFLRQDLRLTGTHVGCEQGVCGACTVLLDGEPVRSCLLFAVQAEGARIETIESLPSEPTELHPVQQAFWEKHGLQCGFCTPGMIMIAADLLARNAEPTDGEIRHALEGNYCRCTGYQNIVAAIREAASTMKAGAAAPAGANA